MCIAVLVDPMRAVAIVFVELVADFFGPLPVAFHITRFILASIGIVSAGGGKGPRVPQRRRTGKLLS
jgi:hypothetical protein